MPERLLITQCLQNDFVQALAQDAPLPNLLHVGHDEAQRLHGDDALRLADAGASPLGRFMAWAYAQAPERLGILHLRDVHDARDPKQAAHLAQFGAHCIAGTSGAEPCFSVAPAHAARPVTVVQSPGLNDFQDTTLAAALAPYANQRTVCGIVGAWTEAKVSFLCYELATRYPQLQLVVCSALTAGASRTAHFHALSQLENLLGVKVVDSIGAFMAALGGGEADAALPTVAGADAARRPAVSVTKELTLSAEDDALVRWLFRDCRDVTLTPLSGGFSGNVVAAVRSVDLAGHEQAPHVLKIGEQDAIAQERAAFERVEAVLGNAAPRIAAHADNRGRGALKYRYAAMGAGASATFQKLYVKGEPQPHIDAILDDVFTERLGRLYAAATRERVELMSYFGFRAGMEERIRGLISMVTGKPYRAGAQAVVPGVASPDLAAFYADPLRGAGARCERRPYVSYVHGDLNGANIIVDARANVWLIDFFHTHRGPALKDLVKLENDLLYIFTPLASELELVEATKLTDTLAAITDVTAPPALRPAEFKTPALQRAAATIVKLRAFYPAIVHEDRDPTVVAIGALRYAAHTLSFDESSPLQKRWALHAAGVWCEVVAKRLGGTTETATKHVA